MAGPGEWRLGAYVRLNSCLLSDHPLSRPVKPGFGDLDEVLDERVRARKRTGVVPAKRSTDGFHSRRGVTVAGTANMSPSDDKIRSASSKGGRRLVS